MNAPHKLDGEDIFVEDSWAASDSDRLERSRRLAWIAASISAAIAMLLAIALVLLLPLKTVEPYTLLVDRQTGHVEALEPLDQQTISADAALTRSFLVQYVIARESFDLDSVSQDYRKVGLWTVGAERQRYLAKMSSANPSSPTQTLPRNAVVRTQVKSVSSLSEKSSLVRFETERSDLNGRAYQPQHWAAVVSYQYSGAAMSADDRLLNPLGFQVTRYRRDAETLTSEPTVEQVGDAPLADETTEDTRP
ncbi:MAG: VirB8/TrbF family protein [Erythrobacter sp.]